jgi:hypothetical protein
MPSYGVSIRDTASDTIQRLISSIRGREYTTPVGEAGKRVLMDHFAQKNADPASHKAARGLGATPSDLYADFARATTWGPSADGVTLSVTHAAARQRLEGGQIRPVSGKYLTIPARGETYGKRAREFGTTLMVLYGRNGPYALAAKADHMRRVTRGPRAGQLVPAQSGQASSYGQGGVYFWLVRQANQAPDPTVLPEEGVFAEGIKAGLKEWLARILGRN